MSDTTTEDRITRQARVLGRELELRERRERSSRDLRTLATLAGAWFAAALVAGLLFIVFALDERSDQTAERYCHQSGRVLQHGWNGRYCVDLLTGKFARVP